MGFNAMARTHTTLPPIYPEQGRGHDRLMDLRRKAGTETVMIGQIGDSRGVVTSFGRNYHAHINASLQTHFAGYPGSTPWTYPSIFGNAQNACAQWLVAGHATASSMPGKLWDSTYHPGTWNTIVPGAVTGSSQGCIWLLQPDCFDIKQITGLNNGDWWDTSADLEAEIMLCPRPDNLTETVFWENRQRSTSAHSYTSGTVLANGSRNVPGIRGPVGSPIQLLRLPVLYGTELYAQIRIYSPETTDPTETIGGRFVTPGKGHGMVVTSISVGGQVLSSVRTNSPKMGAFLRAANFDALWIRLFQNDAYSSNLTPAVVKMNLRNLIAWLREESGDSSKLIIVSNCHPRPDGTTTEDERFSEYAGAAADICDEDPNVVFLNTYRACERRGWLNAKESLTGLTFRGQWAAATAYDVDDLVAMGVLDDQLPQAGSSLWKCTIAHTSASDFTDSPAGTADSTANRRWIRHRQYNGLDDETTALTADDDHPNNAGAQMIAQIEAQLLAGGYHRPNAPRSRIT
jgi:lysophospholipase L1-like esterase